MKKNRNLIPFCIGSLLILIMVAFGYFALNNKIISKTPPLIEAIPKEDIKIKEPSDMEFNITSLGNLIV
ncbi:MAG: hypothetical protein ACRC30_13135, partial [Clostridium sp.]